MDFETEKREVKSQKEIPRYSLGYWDIRALSYKDRD